jgi:hypothetical protein
VVSGRRSRSVRFLAAVLAAVAVLGIAAAGRWLFDLRSSVVDVQPRLLQVARQARGVITLGEGLTVSMYAAGLRVQRQDQLAFETVVLGSLVSAGLGHLEGRAGDRREHLDATFDNVRIDSVEASARGATYRGAVFDDERRSLPLTLTATRVQQRVDLRVTVPGADLVVLHAARQALTVGVPPRLPARNLRERVWWAAPQTRPDEPAFTTLLGFTVGIDAPYPTALDLRQVRRNEIHVWGPTLRLSIYDNGASAPTRRDA